MLECTKLKINLYKIPTTYIYQLEFTAGNNIYIGIGKNRSSYTARVLMTALPTQ